MSNQAGVWHYDHKPILREQLHALEGQLATQGPDSDGKYEEPGFAMLYRAFYITTEDALETQPLQTVDGNVLTWDGRLDNRSEVLAELGRSQIDLPTDSEIVSAALSTWGTGALPRLIGDWALIWWMPRQRRLLLARDYIGIRKLYYLSTKDGLRWSTDLAALVLHSGERYTLCDSYFAGYFTNYPEPQLTPYQEIQLVPPGGYLEVTPGKIKGRRYWSFNHHRAVSYRSDAEYEAHFRQLFRQSIRRRMRTAYPILADLSGGLDSSSIVCMAYDILRTGEAHANINTVSYFSTDEPGADERPYFKSVEDHIGKSGTHFEIRYDATTPLLPISKSYFVPLPGYFDHMLENERRLLDETVRQRNRLHWSGLGGDELLGGVQNPIPDLASLLWSLRLPDFWQQLQTWAIQRKTTVWSLLGRSLVHLAPVWMQTQLARDKATDLARWLRPEFIRQEHIRRRRLRIVADWTDWLPGITTPDSSYLSLAAGIAGYLPRFTFAEQTALPYYDRDLVQFLLSIPGEQLLRPQQRRSLMRRALAGILPGVVVGRKSKWLGRRQPLLQMLDSVPWLNELLRSSPIGQLYVDTVSLQRDLKDSRQGKDVPLLLIERVLGTCVLYSQLRDRGLWIPGQIFHMRPQSSPHRVFHIGAPS